MTKILLLIACTLSLISCTTSKQKITASMNIEKSVTASNPINQAVDLIQNNNYSEAKKVLDEFVEKRPNNWAARMSDNKTVRVFFWDKEQLAECGIFEIVAAGNKKMEPVMDSSYSKAYYLLAYLALESRNNPYNNALLNLDKGLELDPEQPTLQYEKAHLYYRLQRPEIAIEEYKKLINSSGCLSDPKRARAYRGLGESLVALAKYDEAETALYTSLKFEGSNKDALNELDYIDKLRNLGKENAPK